MATGDDHEDLHGDGGPGTALRRVVAVVALLNLLGMIGEIIMAVLAGSVALFADAADFCEDFLINGLVVAALGWSVRGRRRASVWLAGLILIPAVAALTTAAWKLVSGEPPEPFRLSFTAGAALALNLLCALLLVARRTEGGSLVRGAWLAARNDVLADALILVAGLVTAARPSIWPDVVIGVAAGAINLRAAGEVYEQARAETPRPGDD